MGSSWLAALLLAVTVSTLSGASPTSASTSPFGPEVPNLQQESIEEALAVIEAASTGSLGEDCATGVGYKSLLAALDPRRYDTARQKADMAAMMLQDLGVARHASVSTELWSAALLDAVARALLASVEDAVGARVVALNASTGAVVGSTWWERAPGGMGEPLRSRDENHALQPGSRPDPNLPWFEDADTSPGLRGWWTLPYFSCKERRWLISYSVSVPPPSRHGIRDFLSMDVDVSGLEVNQCNVEDGSQDITGDGENQIASFRDTHKCHETTQCEYQSPASRVNGKTIGAGWMKGAYVCRCRMGYYSASHHQFGFNGTLVEAAWKSMKENKTDLYDRVFRCSPCAPGCRSCRGPEPCLATYNWPFRIALLAVSVSCAFGTVVLVGYMYQYRKLKVFKVASPIFLSITLLGCAIMYLEMAAIFPVLDIYSCIATKWSRHLGFCITYTALLMKTWRVSLTYRVKSAHKVKLTDKQLLQWMVPILLVMLIYLGTWTLSAPPIAEVIADSHGLLFNQCSFNWWDHSMAIGEVFFLAWGIKVCYNVRNAESLFNEARLISYAIYNIAVVNTAMVAIHLFIFPQAGPDIKYLLGFVRTQLSTSVTVFLVFGPKVLRVLRGQGDQWDSRARVSASFSLNGIGLVPEETADLSQENEELKEEIQKLAAQIEFMKIVHMEMHNRHIKPKAGGYFSTPGHGHPSSAQSPIAKSSTASFILKAQHFCQSAVERGATAAAAAAVEDSTFPSGSLHRARRREMRKEREREREREGERERERAERAERAEKTEKEPTEQPQKSAERV